MLDAAAQFIDALRPDAPARAAITRSFRSVRELLMFVNDVCAAIEKAPDRPDAFRYTGDRCVSHLADATGTADAASGRAIGVVTADSDARAGRGGRGRDRAAAASTARRFAIATPACGGRSVPATSASCSARARATALFEAALARRGVPYYVYKGLGFFDADEVKDVLALVAYLADPGSHLRAAAFLRSRIVRLSDEALKLLAPDLASALTGEHACRERRAARPTIASGLILARASIGAWIADADQVPPAEIVDRVLAESAYAVEIGGAGFAQARENLKKIRGLIRRIQNRGYATLARLTDYFDGLAAGGDESNAIIDAADAVNLMTVHAAKGLEFPVVFIVNIGKGSGGNRGDIRIAPAPFVDDEADDGEPVGDDQRSRQRPPIATTRTRTTRRRSGCSTWR